ncbi:aminotransferase class I/II-fold pyridoxal phosphate-dependent enzyme [Anaerotruncus massiliensis (ex Liu et al. 2021)]|uniref:aminotransferase class I/II-fold pyridoxal phosphate-dependent enzyme n=1 Tax=Anaerotruncus massiliensis (ex Liu et al. 2021) TaxID=2321404 RepID=UPI003AF75AAA
MDYDKILSRRAVALKPSGIRRFFDIAAEMDDVISLGVGEPDFKTPWSIRRAGIESLERGHTWYTANSGLAPLKKEIANYLRRRFTLEYDAKTEVLVTVGGSEAIDLAIRTLVNPGDEVLVVEPSFVCYTPITALTDGVPVPIATKPEDGFRLTPEALRAAITPKTKLLVLPFPNNPTGGIMRREHLEAVAEVLRGTDIMVLSDEIYAELTYDGERHVSFAEIDGMKERTVIVNGFSKSYAMTGWRLGYAVGPAPVIAQMTKVHQFAIMCAPTTSQYAAVEALKNCDGDIEEMRDSYDMRRRLLVDGLNRMGLRCFEPEGAFYVFPSIRETGMASGEFCEKLLAAEHVAVIPGDAFGESGEGFVRISYSYSVNHLLEALKRIERFLKTL